MKQPTKAELIEQNNALSRQLDLYRTIVLCPIPDATDSWLGEDGTAGEVSLHGAHRANGGVVLARVRGDGWERTDVNTVDDWKRYTYEAACRGIYHAEAGAAERVYHKRNEILGIAR